jgi:hypothetical protein
MQEKNVGIIGSYDVLIGGDLQAVGRKKTYSSDPDYIVGGKDNGKKSNAKEKYSSA